VKLFKLTGPILAFSLGSLFLIGAGPQDNSKQQKEKEVVKGDPAKGKKVYEDHCAICHEVTSEDKIGLGLKGIAKKGPHTLADGTVHKDHGPAVIRKQIVEGGGAMRPIEPPLSEQELDDVIAYLMTL